MAHSSIPVAALLAALLVSISSASSSPPGASPPLSYRTLNLNNGVELSTLFGGAPLGSAPVILFLHGFPEGSWSWASTIQAGPLNAYTLVAPDLRGYNQSSHTGPGGYAVDAIAEDVVALVAALGESKVHLVAHDWGGAVAWFVAAGHSEVLHSLTIVNMPHPVGWVTAVRNDPAQQAASAYVLEFVNPAFTDIAIADDFALLRGIYASEPWWTPDVAAAYVRSWSVPGSVDAALDWYRSNVKPLCPLTCTSPSCWSQGLTSAFDDMPAQGFTPPTLPVRVLFGMRDTAFDDVWQIKFLASKVNGTLDVTQYPNGTHWLAQEMPGVVAADIADFVNQQQSAVALLSAPPVSNSGSATYTPSGSALNASDFAFWLTAQAAAGVTTLILAPGSYTVAYPPGSRAHVSFPPLSGVSIVCVGVALTMMSRTEGALYISAWQSVSLSGLTVHYAEPPSNSARIVAVHAQAPFSLDVLPEAGMPLGDWQAGTVTSCNVFDSSTRLMKPFTWDLKTTSLLPLAGGLFRFALSNTGDLANIAAGDYLGCRVVGGHMTVTVDGIENCTFTDLTLHGGPSFGVLESGGSSPGARGGNTYERLTITFPLTPPGAAFPPLLSTSADGFHSAGSPRGPTIIDSLIEGNNDDGIAIHGLFTLIVDADVASGRIWVATHGSFLEYSVGSELLLYDSTFAPRPTPAAPAFAPAALYTIKAATALPPSYRPPHNVSHTMPSQSLVVPGTSFAVLTLDAATPLPSDTAFDWVLSDKSKCGNGFTLRNNTIRNHRARGMLIKASHGVIEDNRITNSSLGGIIITPELYWREASYAHELVVRNNSIDLRSSGRQSYGGIALGAVAPGGGLAVAQGHSAIAILDNTLTQAGYAPIWLSSAGNVTLLRNTLLQPFPAPPNNTYLPTCCEPVLQHVAVYATHVKGLTAQGNCIAPAPAPNSALESLFVATDDVTGDFAGGVTLC